MPELSIVVPFINEYPQIIFTIQNIAQELRDRVDFEILAVDNSDCPEMTQWVKQGKRVVDKGGEVVAGSTRVSPWLRSLKYAHKLSHWQAKNFGVANSKSPILFFLDSHCIVSRDALYKMFIYYKEHQERLNGSLHLPLTYKILESHKTMYKLVVNLDTAEIHYSLTGYRHAEQPYEVPAVSTCGMMMSRKVYDDLGGWPIELGIYGGGENFTNFTKAVLGKKKWMFPGEPLFHHGEKRGYEWNRDDYVRNRCIATYMFGGSALALKMIQNTKGNPGTLQAIYQNVITTCGSHREFIKKKQVIDIVSWLRGWM